MIRIEQGTIVTVSYRTAGTQLVGDHAIGVTELLVDDCYDLNKPAGSLTIGDETLTYSSVDDDLDTVYLTAPTTVDYDDLAPIGALPVAPVKIATVTYPGAGEAVPARLLHVLDPLLPEGVRDPDEQESILLLVDESGEPVVLDVLGRESAIDPATIDYPVITNLYTDPKPADFLNWVGGPGGGGGGAFNPSITADSSHADLGFHLKFTASSIGVGKCSFAPNGAGMTVSHAGLLNVFALGSAVASIPFTDNISYSFRFWSPLGGVTFTAMPSFFTAAGVNVPVSGFGSTTGGGTFPAGTNGSCSGYIDYDTIIGTNPDIAWVTTVITCEGTVNGQDVFLGRAMAVYGDQQMPYRDGDSLGWVWNPDGTSTGRINLDTITSWQDLTGVQPPPAAHTHVAADITDFNTAVRTNRLDQMAAPTGSVSMGSQTITSLAPGLASTDAVNKAQLDAVATAAKTRQYMPLTTTVGGAPDLVWDANNELVLLEVPLP